VTPPPDAVVTRSRSGLIYWPGKVRQNQVFTVENQFPGSPIQLNPDPSLIEIVEAPSAANRWNRAVLRAKGDGPEGVTIRWSSLP
jgi:hypothetical protein